MLPDPYPLVDEVVVEGQLLTLIDVTEVASLPAFTTDILEVSGLINDT